MFLLLEAAWIHPESFEAMGRYAGGDEINGFSGLVDYGDL
jgi:hypothetical protein